MQNSNEQNLGQKIAAIPESFYPKLGKYEISFLAPINVHLMMSCREQDQIISFLFLGQSFFAAQHQRRKKMFFIKVGKGVGLPHIFCPSGLDLFFCADLHHHFLPL